LSVPSQSRSFTTIEFEVSEAVATITLNRPEQLNALDPTMERELLQVWDLVDGDDEVVRRSLQLLGRLLEQLRNAVADAAGNAMPARLSTDDD